MQTGAATVVATLEDPGGKAVNGFEGLAVDQGICALEGFGELAAVDAPALDRWGMGLLALGLFVYGLGMGQTILVAGMVLALLILPIVIVATREAIRSIPLGIKEAAYAIGCDQWQAMWSYVLPAARPGILTGVIVGLSRAVGETAPVITIGALTFIAFLPPSPIQAEPPFLSFEWLFSPFTVMPIQMFNWVSRPQAAFHVNAAATGVILMAMTLAMNAIAIWIRYRLRKQLRM